MTAIETVMSYIDGMGKRDYPTAKLYLGENVFIKGPAGEAFQSADEFLNMMEKQRGSYDMKKIFVDGDDVCLLYDFVTEKVTTFFASWYQVKEGKIVTIRTVFDPRAFTT